MLISLAMITLLIVIHEFGHFLAARHYGFQTPAFGIGLPFGPTINLFKRWGTQFKFHWLLIGGYVAIPELGDETDASAHKDMDIKLPLKEFPVGQRAVVASAGVVFNILFAFLLAIIMSATIGLPKAVPANSINDFSRADSPAEKIGLEKGDLIIAINGLAINNGSELQQAIKNTANQDIIITIKRSLIEDDSTDAEAKYETLEFKTHSEGALGIVLGYSKEYQKFAFNPLVWVTESAKFIAVNLASMFLGVLSLLGTLFGKILSIFNPELIKASGDLGQVKGIVGIIQIISEDIKHNAYMLLEFAVLISLNLAVINLLPIPALDGGHLLFMAYEAVTGKKADENFQGAAIQLGFLFLLSIMAITTFNDLKNWIFH